MPIKRKQTLGVIRLHNAVFYAYHGVLLDEQNLGGKFEVDVELHCDLTRGAKSDHLDDTVNYERVYDCIRTLVMEKKHFLLESLASAIGRGILKNFPKVFSVTVKVRKPSAPVKGIIDYVEVELMETRR
ncbi:MAG: dihydroneopterin aldolase [Ignavibacteriae bacterium]|nr:MAG: dihydroneopterin aldolase [Ignavibacteriota bacterium]